MIRHVVLFKLKEEHKHEIPEMIKQGLAMKEGIPELVDFQMGEDFIHSARSCDIVLIATVKDKADLEIYANHPLHLPLKKHLAEIAEQVVSGDFEF